MTQTSDKIAAHQLNTVLATDCGSTTTKAILFEKTSSGWRQTFRGEAPTTVEKPVADVTIGAVNAFEELEEISKRPILDRSKIGSNEAPLLKRRLTSPDQGVDLYVSTSSAGGGLQMVVAGVVRSMTAESAERAALGAGAIVMDTVSIDDGREPHERVQKIRHLRPDILLIAGGTEGGNMDHPLELAEMVLQADPRPRFGETLRLPVIFAANSKAAKQAEEILNKRFAFTAVPNIRPALDRENLTGARDAIHEVFLNHVMSHAPGYSKLLGWSPVPIIPTPAAVGDMVQLAAKRLNKQILAVDIGGATTDVFSVFSAGEGAPPVFNRTVSANLGMSYSIANVLLEAGPERIGSWLPFELNRSELYNRLQNKMIRPTTIPYLLEDLLIEQAVCREALRLAFEHHKRLVVGLKGVKRRRTIGDIFRQGAPETLVNMFDLNLIIGSGGVLSHAPDRGSAALMMIDAYQPLGITELAVDSIFMMPHLGVFGSVHPEAAAEIFIKDCLVPLGTVIAPAGRIKPGQPAFEVAIEGEQTLTCRGGELIKFAAAAGAKRGVKIRPLQKELDFGAGPGQTVSAEVSGGEVGLILDGRGRPFIAVQDEHERIRRAAAWHAALGINTGEKPRRAA